MLDMTNMLGIFTVINLKKSPYFYKKILVSKKHNKTHREQDCFLWALFISKELVGKPAGSILFFNTSKRINFKSSVLVAPVEVDDTFTFVDVSQ